MYMFKYVLKRIGLMLMTFSIIITMCFVLIKMLPQHTNFCENSCKVTEWSLYISSNLQKGSVKLRITPVLTQVNKDKNNNNNTFQLITTSFLETEVMLLSPS